MLLERVRDELQVPLAVVENIGLTASHRYYTFKIKKKDGGDRTINHPARELKALQRWLLRNIIEQMPIHNAATAYHHTGGIRENAIRHADQRFLLRMDFRDFFPSINDADISRTLDGLDTLTEQWDDRDRRWFLRVITRRGRLCIGAPSSPWLSNAVCYQLDSLLATECETRNVRYTRYADDLGFSSSVPDRLWELPNVVQRMIDESECPGRLIINDEKTRHSSKKGRRIITGLVITPTGAISVGRPLKRKVKALVFGWKALSKDQRKWLSGMLAHIQDIEPAFMNSLALKYGVGRIKEAMKA